MNEERKFPIQGEWGGIGVGEIPPSTVPWSEAEIAYQTHSTLYGTEQSLERLAERGKQAETAVGVDERAGASEVE